MLLPLIKAQHCLDAQQGNVSKEGEQSKGKKGKGLGAPLSLGYDGDWAPEQPVCI